MNRQCTYFVAVAQENEDLKRIISLSGLAFIIDWNHGWFEIPDSMYEEFRKVFDLTGECSSVCSCDISKEKIIMRNKSLMPEFNFCFGAGSKECLAACCNC